MKGIFAIMLALCIGACASPPAMTVAADHAAVNSTAQAQPSKPADSGSPDRVYLDDYDRVPFQEPARRIGPRTLGAKSGQ
jgi:hypothetical protein